MKKPPKRVERTDRQTKNPLKTADRPYRQTKNPPKRVYTKLYSLRKRTLKAIVQFCLCGHTDTICMVVIHFTLLLTFSPSLPATEVRNYFSSQCKLAAVCIPLVSVSMYQSPYRSRCRGVAHERTRTKGNEDPKKRSCQRVDVMPWVVGWYPRDRRQYPLSTVKSQSNPYDREVDRSID